MNQRKSVALIVETATHYGREVLAGILRYKIEGTDWRIFLEEHDLHAPPPLWVKDWPGDGIICRLTTPEVGKIATERGIPFVELTDHSLHQLDLVAMHADDLTIGTWGAEHLIERGFRKFAYVGYEGKAWSNRRERAFRERVVADNHFFDQIDLPEMFPVTGFDVQKRLIAWLHRLPKPIGILAGNDFRAKQVLDACLAEEIAVPEKVAVLGVDNDELICKFCEPMLSSIVPGAKELGYRAAKALDELMSGGEVSPMSQVVEPIDICLRESTDTIAIEDPELTKALVFIRKKACEGITVEDVLAHTSLSRSSLERRTRKLLHRSPQQEIRKTQLNRVKTLLLETDMLIENIAAECGFDHPEYLHVMFKREYQVTPGEYRKLAHR